jgi:hypothetical protein
MTEEEDRLRALLRAPLTGAAHAGERVQFRSLHRSGRARRIAMISAVVVTIALVTGVVAAFRVTAHRPRLDAGGAVSSPAPTRNVPMRSMAALTRDVRCGRHQPVAGRDQLRGFRPVAAVRCEQGAQGSKGTRDVTDGPFGALVAGLEHTDAPPGDGPCATYYDVQPSLVLVDASGRSLRPRFPRDGCGHVRGTAAYLAYAKLIWRPMARRRRVRTSSAPPG